MVSKQYAYIHHPPSPEKLYKTAFHINFGEVDASGKATITSLSNYLQEAAWQHAMQYQAGYREMHKNNTAFVIHKMLLKLRCLPSWNDYIIVETWLRPPQQLHALREFTIRDAKLNLIAAASIQYLAINTQTRKIEQFPTVMETAYLNAEFLDEEPANISIAKNNYGNTIHKVRPSDLDLNQHANNGKYLQWVFDYMPFETNCQKHLCCVKINYKHEARLNDELNLFFIEKNNLIKIHGFNQTAGKTSFTAELKYKCLPEKN